MTILCLSMKVELEEKEDDCLDRPIEYAQISYPCEIPILGHAKRGVVAEIHSGTNVAIHATAFKDKVRQSLLYIIKIANSCAIIAIVYFLCLNFTLE